MSNISAQLNNSDLKITQAAKLLGVSRSTLMRMEEKGEITSKRLDNGYRVFSKQDILNLKNNQNNNSRPTSYYNSQQVIEPVQVVDIEPLKQEPTTAKEFNFDKYIHSNKAVPVFDKVIHILIRSSIGLGFLTSLVLSLSFKIRF